MVYAYVFGLVHAVYLIFVYVYHCIPYGTECIPVIRVVLIAACLCDSEFKLYGLLNLGKHFLKVHSQST